MRNGQKRQLLRRSAAYIIQVAVRVLNIGFNSGMFRMADCTVAPLHRTVSGSSMDLDLALAPAGTRAVILTAVRDLTACHPRPPPREMGNTQSKTLCTFVQEG